MSLEGNYSLEDSTTSFNVLFYFFAKKWADLVKISDILFHCDKDYSYFGKPVRFGYFNNLILILIHQLNN